MEQVLEQAINPQTFCRRLQDLQCFCSTTAALLFLRKDILQQRRKSQGLKERWRSARAHLISTPTLNELHLSLHPLMKVWITRAALWSPRSLICSRITSRESFTKNRSRNLGGGGD